jgi:hypothetical protein
MEHKDQLQHFQQLVQPVVEQEIELHHQEEMVVQVVEQVL